MSKLKVANETIKTVFVICDFMSRKDCEHLPSVIGIVHKVEANISKDKWK